MSRSQTPGKPGLQWPPESWDLGLEYWQDPPSLISASLLTSFTPAPGYEQALGALSIPSPPARRRGKARPLNSSLKIPGKGSECTAGVACPHMWPASHWPGGGEQPPRRPLGPSARQDEDMLFPEERVMVSNKESRFILCKPTAVSESVLKSQLFSAETSDKIVMTRVPRASKTLLAWGPSSPGLFTVISDRAPPGQS